MPCKNCNKGENLLNEKFKVLESEILIVKKLLMPN